MRRLLVVVGLAWVAVSLAAAWVAIDRSLPYDLAFLDRAGSIARIQDDWVYGWGTGLAVPLAFIVAVAVTTVMSILDGPTGRLGAISLAALGAVAFAYTLANQVTDDRLSAAVPDRTVNALILANLVLCVLLVIVGIAVWATTPKDDFH